MDRVLLPESTVVRGMRLKSERKHVEDDAVERGMRLKSERKHVEDDAVERGTLLKSKRKHGERGKRQKSERKQVEDDAVERGMRLKSERKHGEDDAVERGTVLKSERKYDIVYFVERGTWVKSERKQVKDDAVERGTLPKEDFNAIAPPYAIAPPRPEPGLMRGSITNDTRLLLVRLSVCALGKYNDNNKQIPEFQFVELVKSKMKGLVYNITFIAKQANQDPSNTLATIFLAKVLDMSNGPPRVKSVQTL